MKESMFALLEINLELLHLKSESLSTVSDM